MADIDAAWLAGLFDGEGTVFMQNVADRPGRQWRVVVSIANTHAPTIERVLALTGSGSVHMDAPRGKQRRQYSWRSSCRNAERFLLTIAKFAVTKREQVQLAISALLLKRRSLRVGVHKRVLSEETHRSLSGISAAIKDFNHHRRTA